MVRRSLWGQLDAIKVDIFRSLHINPGLNRNLADAFGDVDRASQMHRIVRSSLFVVDGLYGKPGEDSNAQY